MLREWRDANGGLTLIGIGLVLHMGRPQYVDRCAISHHWLPTIHSSPAELVDVSVDFRALARRLATDTASTKPNIGGLSTFLSVGNDRPLLEDVRILMQETRSHIEPFWLDFLIAGRQSYPLWDLRVGRLHPAGAPLRLDHRDNRLKTRRPMS